MTAAAFVAFAGAALDLAVLEVGLGGRLDATNVAPARLSVVTSIGLDHVEDLGPTVAPIAARRPASSARPSRARPGPTSAEARAVFAEAAAVRGARCTRSTARRGGSETDLSRTRLRLTTPVRRYDLATPLPGRAPGGKRGPGRARGGAAGGGAAHRRRGHRAPASPRCAGRGGWSDFAPGRARSSWTAATTPRAPRRWRAFLVDAGLRGDLVFGAMADKDIEAIGRLLLPRVRARPLRGPRRGRPARRRSSLRRAARTRAASLAAASVESALAGGARGDSRTEPIIVAGSLYLVGEARSLLLSGRFD